MRNRTMVYGAASVYKGINLRGREAYTTVPNNVINITRSINDNMDVKSGLGTDVVLLINLHPLSLLTLSCLLQISIAFNSRRSLSPPLSSCSNGRRWCLSTKNPSVDKMVWKAGPCLPTSLLSTLCGNAHPKSQRVHCIAFIAFAPR